MAWLRAGFGWIWLIALGSKGCHARDEPPPTARVGGVAPGAADASAKAARVCTTLLEVPARRKAECCGGEPVTPLRAQCARTVQASLTSGASELDEAALAACTRALDDSLRGCDWVTPGQPLLPAACQQLLLGRLAAGALCHSTLECVAPLHCDGATPAQAGRCRPPAAMGETCGVPLDPLVGFTQAHQLERAHPPCQDFCSLVTHRCEAMPALGASCAASVNCANGQRCVDGQCAAGSRAPKAAAGERCEGDLDCERGGCVGGRCGMQCTSPLTALHALSAGLRLPTVKRR